MKPLLASVKSVCKVCSNTIQVGHEIRIAGGVPIHAFCYVDSDLFSNIDVSKKVLLAKFCWLLGHHPCKESESK